MSSLDALQRRIDSLLAAIEQRRKSKRLPHIVYDAATGETLPAYQEVERAAATQGVTVKAYGDCPDDDGTEP